MPPGKTASTALNARRPIVDSEGRANRPRVLCAPPLPILDRSLEALLLYSFVFVFYHWRSVSFILVIVQCDATLSRRVLFRWYVLSNSCLGVPPACRRRLLFTIRQ